MPKPISRIHHPIESNNIDWRNVRFKVKTDNATTDYNIVSQLWGGLPDGSEQLVAEWIDPTISTTETTKEALFDLNNSSTLPSYHTKNLGALPITLVLSTSLYGGNTMIISNCVFHGRKDTVIVNWLC